jgi:hypothetical protein
MFDISHFEKRGDVALRRKGREEKKKYTWSTLQTEFVS